MEWQDPKMKKDEGYEKGKIRFEDYFFLLNAGFDRTQDVGFWKEKRYSTDCKFSECMTISGLDLEDR